MICIGAVAVLGANTSASTTPIEAEAEPNPVLVALSHSATESDQSSSVTLSGIMCCLDRKGEEGKGRRRGGTENRGNGREGVGMPGEGRKKRRGGKKNTPSVNSCLRLCHTVLYFISSFL